MSDELYLSHNQEVQVAINFYDKYIGRKRIKDSDPTRFTIGAKEHEKLLSYALETDPSGVAFWCAFLPIFEEFINSPALKLSSVVEAPGSELPHFDNSVIRMVYDYLALKRIVDQGEMSHHVEALRTSIRERIGKMLNQKMDIAEENELLNNLTRYQQEIQEPFEKMRRLAVSKNPNSSSYPETFHSNVLAVTNHHELINLATDAPDGFTIAFVFNEKHFEASYYVWIAKQNGNTLLFQNRQYGLTGASTRGGADQEYYRHFRFLNDNDKAFAFPFAFMEKMDSSDNKKEYTLRDATGHHGVGPAVIGSIRDLEPKEILHLSLATEAIANSWKEDISNAELVYHENLLLLPSGPNPGSTEIAVLDQDLIEAPKLLANTFSHEQFVDAMRDLGFEKPESPIEPSFIFEQLEPELLSRLPAADLLPVEPVEIETPPYRVKESDSKPGSFFSNRYMVTKTSATIDPVSGMMGTEKEVLLDTYVEARLNQRELVCAHLLAEYQPTEREIVPWLYEKLTNAPLFQRFFAELKTNFHGKRSKSGESLENFFKIRPELLATLKKYKSLHDTFQEKGRYENIVGFHHTLKYYVKKTGRPDHNQHSVQHGGFIGHTDENGCAICPVTGGKGTIFIELDIGTAFELAFLLNMKREDLPYGLAFAGLNNQYTGDPLHSIKHPGQDINLRIVLAVSLKGLCEWASWHGVDKPTWNDVDQVKNKD